MYMFQSVLRIRIRDPVPIWPKIRIQDEHFGLNFRELRKKFWLLKFFDADADPDPGSDNLFDPECGIRDGKNSNPE